MPGVRRTTTGSVDTSGGVSQTLSGRTFDWQSSTDWDNAQNEFGVVHESVTNTDYNDDASVTKGYSAANPFKPTNLELFAPFHEDSGSTANDFSGNNRDGSIAAGVTLGAAGVLGNTGYSFAGNDGELVGFGDLDAWEIAEAGDTATVALWVKPDSEQNSFALVKDGEYGFHADDTTGGNNSITPRWDMFGDNNLDSVSDSIPTGSWNLVMFGIDAGTTVTTYVNGTKEGDDTNLTDTSSGFTATLDVGDNSAGTGLGFAGDIAHVAIWTEKFTDTEASNYYNVVGGTSNLETAVKTISEGFTPTQLTTTSTLNGGSIDIVVKEDTNQNGTADNTQTVTLTGGTNETNSLSGFSGGPDTDIWVDIQLYGTTPADTPPEVSGASITTT